MEGGQCQRGCSGLIARLLGEVAAVRRQEPRIPNFTISAFFLHFSQLRHHQSELVDLYIIVSVKFDYVVINPRAGHRTSAQTPKLSMLNQPHLNEVTRIYRCTATKLAKGTDDQD
jgi:hypothetical protein